MTATHDDTCPLCQHTATHHHLPPGISHCRTCGDTWNQATKTAHCARCHISFSAPGGFDRHIHRSEHVEPAHRAMHPVTNTHGTVIWRMEGDRDSP